MRMGMRHDRCAPMSRASLPPARTPRPMRHMRPCLSRAETAAAAPFSRTTLAIGGAAHPTAWTRDARPTLASPTCGCVAPGSGLGRSLSVGCGTRSLTAPSHSPTRRAHRDTPPASGQRADTAHPGRHGRGDWHAWAISRTSAVAACSGHQVAQPPARQCGSSTLCGGGERKSAIESRATAHFCRARTSPWLSQRTRTTHGSKYPCRARPRLRPPAPT